MTYLDLIRNADYKLENDAITLGEYEQMIEPLNREIQPERKKGKWIPVTNGRGGHDIAFIMGLIVLLIFVYITCCCK